MNWQAGMTVRDLEDIVAMEYFTITADLIEKLAERSEWAALRASAIFEDDERI